MIAVFIIFFMGYLKAKNDDYVGGFAVASYVSFVIGLLFWVMGLLTGMDFALILGVAMISSVVLLCNQRIKWIQRIHQFNKDLTHNYIW